MKIYNTMSKRKEEFVPLEPGKVKMYVCGPTVYNFIHIGNARPYVVFDTMRRYLEYKGYEVQYIQNFTDVDDKIINRANEENVTMEALANKYIEEVLKDAEGLNVKKATHHPRVTEEMPQIIEMITTLMDKGFAYEKQGTVYFNTDAFADYGKLSHKNLEDLEAGARVDVDSLKEHTSDFVLWKPNKPGEPKWESPWGSGRPGWHIECSAMAKRYLGETIDIHAGGEDLIFPHHENEVAQSECANGTTFAKYWMHNGFINVDNQKMSKSKGNFFLLRDIVESFPYEVVRFFILSGHYRMPINFSDELVKSAEASLTRIKTAVKNLQFKLENASCEKISDEELKLVDEAKKFRADFEESMDDDLNTADAVTAIFEFVKFANINVTDSSSKEFAEKIKSEINLLGEVLGLNFEQDTKNENNEDAKKIEELIAKRQDARKAKDFGAADKIRNELQEMGVVLEDTSQGVRWSYK